MHVDIRKTLSKTMRRVWPELAAIDRQAAHYQETSWYTPSELAAYQARLLQELLAHCWSSVPYYRRLMEETGATRPGDTSLAQLPTLSKEQIRVHFDELRSDDLDDRRWYVNSSGGSTGEPVRVIQDRDYAVRSEARKVVCFEMAGYEPGDYLALLWGSQRDILVGGVGPRAAVGSFLRNMQTMNAFRMTPELMRSYLASLGRRPPRLLYAYGQAVFELARYAQAHGISVTAPGAIVTTSETLYPYMRETIEAVFGCEVFDQYGSREVSCIAQECDQHQGLHLNLETLVVEILDDDGAPCPPGVEGDVVITSLLNRAMPLVRYRIGDRATAAAHLCACGRGLPLLDHVAGRGFDAIRRSDGTVIPGIYFLHFISVVYNRPWIAKFQVVQTDYDRIVMKVVSNGVEPTAEEREELAHIVHMAMGEECRTEIELVDEIPNSESGKYRYTLSLLDEA